MLAEAVAACARVWSQHRSSAVNYCHPKGDKRGTTRMNFLESLGFMRLIKSCAGSGPSPACGFVQLRRRVCCFVDPSIA